jgi:GTPase SAR1 family protein
LKLILLGAAGSGKTALCNRFVDDSYHASYKATLGADMRDKTITVGDETVTLQIWVRFQHACFSPSFWLLM